MPVTKDQRMLSKSQKRSYFIVGGLASRAASFKNAAQLIEPGC